MGWLTWTWLQVNFRSQVLVTLTWSVEKFGNLRAREVVLGYELPESEHQVLANQMNLLLSQVGTAFEDVQLLGDELSRLEHQVAGKLLEYVHQTQLRDLVT